MKVSARILAAALAIPCALAVSAPALHAQSASDCTDYTCIQLFSAVNGAPSLPGVTYSNPDPFNTTTLNMTCPAAPTPVVAILSGPNTVAGAPPTPPLVAGGNLLVDNNLLISVTPSGQNAQVLTDVCPLTNFTEGTAPPYQLDCFTTGYQGIAGSVIGHDPDTFTDGGSTTIDYAGGVPPINIASPFTPTAYDTNASPPAAPSPAVGIVNGSQSVTISVVDTGGSYTSSSIFLTTNCTATVSAGSVEGNAIVTGENGSGLEDLASFNTQNGQTVQLLYSLTGANSALNNVLSNSGAIPKTSDQPINPATFQTDHVAGTSFATSNCLEHTGESMQGVTGPACKLYTLQCYLYDSELKEETLSGANCPVSELDDEVIQDTFDGPAFSLQPIFTPFGVFNEGIGLLMASETWPMTTDAPSDEPGPCTFDSASGLELDPCPANLLISFSGPGSFDGTGETKNPNSTFISIYGVPEDMTSVFVPGEWPDH